MRKHEGRQGSRGSDLAQVRETLNIQVRIAVGMQGLLPIHGTHRSRAHTGSRHARGEALALARHQG